MAKCPYCYYEAPKGPAPVVHTADGCIHRLVKQRDEWKDTVITRDATIESLEAEVAKLKEDRDDWKANATIRAGYILGLAVLLHKPHANDVGRTFMECTDVDCVERKKFIAGIRQE